jgi:aspartyl-tRNA(Asn)/glutamyl-tRNA(Gln) amidotransferase subunit A
MHKKTIFELAEALQSRAVSSVELTQHFLSRIAAFDSTLNSFISVTAEQAL